MKLNKHYSELNESYLFSTIAHKVAAYQKANPDKDIIRLGIGDVTLPLAKSVTDAMLKAVEEQGKKETFHGYIPSEQGYEFLRSAIQKYYAGHGVELDMAEIFVSDGAKSDLGNLLDLFDVDNTVLVPDPVYPVYVDDNVMAGRKILYMSASAENNFLPMPDDKDFGHVQLHAVAGIVFLDGGTQEFIALLAGDIAVESFFLALLLTAFSMASVTLLASGSVTSPMPRRMISLSGLAFW